MWWLPWLVVVAQVLPGLGDGAAPDRPAAGCPALSQLLAACPPRGATVGGGSAIAACVSCINAHDLPTASCSQRELFALCRSHAGGARRGGPPPSLAPSGVLSAKDFGATGDGRTDDHSALQAAIHAAQRQGRALLLPAGDYLVNAELRGEDDRLQALLAGRPSSHRGARCSVECSVPNCCEACNTSQTNCPESACGPLQFNPLRMMGEAQFATRVIAGPSFSGGAL